MTAIHLPSLGENVHQGTVVGILVSIGDVIEEGDPIIEVETDKVTVEVPAPSGGEIRKILVAEGDEVTVGQAILEIVGEATSVKSTAEVESISEVSSTSLTEAREAVQTTEAPTLVSPRRLRERTSQRATPKARKLARELGVSISDVTSDNPSIQAADVKTSIRTLGPPITSNQQQPDPLPNFDQWGSTSIQPMSGVMKATAANMAKAWATIPHAWITEQADITKLEAERKKMNESMGSRMSTTVFIIKAVAHCLKTFPIFNSSIDIATQQVIQKHYYNIGVAVDTDNGLFVPVLNDIDKKGLSAIDNDLREVAERAKSKRLSMADLTGSNFTISNLGGIGTTSIFPIINPPEVGILGLGRYQVVGGNKILPMTLAFDHRCINGADAARFLVFLKGLLEEPVLLLL